MPLLAGFLISYFVGLVVLAAAVSPAIWGPVHCTPQLGGLTQLPHDLLRRMPLHFVKPS